MLEVTTTWLVPHSGSGSAPAAVSVRLRSVADIQTLFDAVPHAWLTSTSRSFEDAPALRRAAVIPLPPLFESSPGAPLAPKELVVPILRCVAAAAVLLAVLTRICCTGMCLTCCRVSFMGTNA